MLAPVRTLRTGTRDSSAMPLTAARPATLHSASRPPKKTGTGWPLLAARLAMVQLGEVADLGQQERREGHAGDLQR